MSITAREENQTSGKRQRGHLLNLLCIVSLSRRYGTDVRRLKKCIPSRSGGRRCGYGATALYSTNWHIPHCPCNAPGVQYRLKHFLSPGNHPAFSAEYAPRQNFLIMEAVLSAFCGRIHRCFRERPTQLVAITMNTYVQYIISNRQTNEGYWRIIRPVIIATKKVQHRLSSTTLR
jgi:hypothetical protein